jgi:ABC-2 type transport system permease protein
MRAELGRASPFSSVVAANGHEISDGFVPAETMPSLLRGFAEHQPITRLVETARALLLDQPIGNAGWIAAAWLTVAVMVSVPTAAVLFRRRTT